MVSGRGLFRQKTLEEDSSGLREKRVKLGSNPPVLGSESLLLPYQQRWVSDNSPLLLYAKSRRIGASYCEALKSVLEAAKSYQPRNTLYITYNFAGTHSFIQDAREWSQNLNLVCSDVNERMFSDEGKDILEYKIRFATGRSITALSGNPRNIRGRGGRITIDECSYVDNLPELIKAATALLMWNGSLSLLSTFDGIENPFTELYEDIRTGRQPNWSLHRTDIYDALRDGLYKRICLVQGKQWSQELEDAWLAQLRIDYGISFSEELEAIPFAAKAGKVFSPDRILVIDRDQIPVGGQELRFWDLAATEKKLKGDAPCYTAGIKMKIADGIVYVLDVIMVQESAGAVDELIKSTAIADGKHCQVRWELEGGSSGIRDASHITKLLIGFDAKAVRPTGDKVTRAKPFASQVNAGNVRMLRSSWNNAYRKHLYAFPDGKVRDSVDASSGAFSSLTTIVRPVAPSGSWSSW